MTLADYLTARRKPVAIKSPGVPTLSQEQLNRIQCPPMLAHALQHVATVPAPLPPQLALRLPPPIL